MKPDRRTMARIGLWLYGTLCLVGILLPFVVAVVRAIR